MIYEFQTKKEMLETIDKWIDSLTFGEENELEINIEPSDVLRAKYNLTIIHDINCVTDVQEKEQ